MPKLSLNLTGVSLNLEPLPEGVYSAVVSTVEQKISTNNRQPYLAWIFELSDSPYEGRKLFYNTSLQEQALWNLARTLKALGFDPGDFTGDMELDTTDLLDIECRVVVTQDVYQGEVRNRVDRVIPAGEPETSTLL